MMTRPVLLLGFLILLLCGCGDRTPIRVGLVAPLTQFSVELGTQGRNGAILAVNEINSKGGVLGRPIELVVRDVGAGPDACSKAIQNLLDSGIQFIVGPYTSNMAQATMDAVRGKVVLLVTPSMSADILGAKDDEIIRLQPSNTQQGHAISDAMHKNGVKSVIAIFDASNKEYAYTLTQSFLKSFTSKGGTLLSLDSIDGTSRTPAQVGKDLAKAKPDAFFFVTTGINLATATQHLRMNGSVTPIYAGSWGMTPELISQGGKAVNGMIFSAPTPPLGSNPRGKQFEKDYREHFGGQASFAAVESWEAITALARGIEETSSFDPAVVKQKLLSFETVEGVYDNFRWDSTGDVMRPQTIVQLHDGIFETVFQIQ